MRGDNLPPTPSCIKRRGRRACCISAIAMIPCDVHRDLFIESYKRPDFMEWTRVMLQVSQQLHRARLPDDKRRTRRSVQWDVTDLLHEMFPQLSCSVDLEEMSAAEDTWPAEDVLETWCVKRNASGVWTLYADVWMPVVYRLVQAQWRV